MAVPPPAELKARCGRPASRSSAPHGQRDRSREPGGNRGPALKPMGDEAITLEVEATAKTYEL